VSEPASAVHAAAEIDPFDDVSLELLRARRSAKWAKYEPDVLPAWVAELDFPLALPIREVLQTAVARDDTGYPDFGRLGTAFAGFAASRFGWQVDPERVRLVPDVMSAVAELLRALVGPGGSVVVNPPVYPPFFLVAREVGCRVVEVPLSDTGLDWQLDLDGLEQAFADGARAYLLCHPHNPTGTSFPPEQLEAVAALGATYNATVLVDEVHAPMTMAGAEHVPFLSIGDAAVENGLALVSASKAWNLAGLKCAQIVTGSGRMHERLQRELPSHLSFHAGHFGVLANIAAYEHGVEWLDALVRHLERNRRALSGLLAEHLPTVGYRPPEAGYLAWLDCRALALGDDPAEVFLERGRVALSPGPPFGEQGRGFARLNFGTSSALLEEAVRRMASALA
jgi:cysteine-S-conjugate beta-lyase